MGFPTVVPLVDGTEEGSVEPLFEVVCAVNAVCVELDPVDICVLEEIPIDVFAPETVPLDDSDWLFVRVVAPMVLEDIVDEPVDETSELDEVRPEAEEPTNAGAEVFADCEILELVEEDCASGGDTTTGTPVDVPATDDDERVIVAVREAVEVEEKVDTGETPELEVCEIACEGLLRPVEEVFSVCATDEE